MSDRRRYRKKADQFVTAVQLELETDGFVYQKWGAERRCQKGDWLVDNYGDVDTVDGEVFAGTYRQLSPGVCVKKTSIWAEVAEEAGAVETKEGKSHYEAGDYLVSNNEDGSIPANYTFLTTSPRSATAGPLSTAIANRRRKNEVRTLQRIG